jgi:hypothetical protein
LSKKELSNVTPASHFKSFFTTTNFYTLSLHPQQFLSILLDIISIHHHQKQQQQQQQQQKKNNNNNKVPPTPFKTKTIR